MEDARKLKRVAIIGAGPSGLTACKHALSKGFRPVVFEAADGVGGVWTRTLASTKLQTPAAAFRFSDFPWPADVTTAAELPRSDQVAAYMAAYARQFGVLERVRFGAKVVAAKYVGAPEREVAAWERWSGNGEAFGDGTGEWHLTVEEHTAGRSSEHTTSTHQQVLYKFDFLILCVGRYGVAKLPTFPEGRGPEVFKGRVLHSMDYSRMPHADADELIRGKRVVVVGSGKSGVDTVAQCAQANGTKHPCTLVYRTAAWMLDPNLTLGASLGTLLNSRLAQLMVHKPEEGFALWLLAAVLSPIGWVVAKVTEAYYRALMPIGKHGTVPDHGLSASMFSWRFGLLPDGFYGMVDDGSVVLKRCGGGSSSLLGFCADGLLLLDDADGEAGERVDADVVILATGFDADRLLSGVFVSPWFQEMVAAGATMLPLYRHCVHPRIPQMAVVGYAESAASIYPYEMMAKWVAHLLDGAVRLPSVAAMERSVAEWERWGRWAKRRGGAVFLKSCIATITTWYHDQLCRDMGYSTARKGGLLAEWLQPYGPTDYASIL
ncbi:hypothetical protein U9M48_038956 [Paspalum notatum var. saurae]|uniref:Flavin-containing monooxygenase n=1 Tax=Paspalum notatum var. saurae TaxID=547442 RepID=A0AAQ3UJ24_PASNO